MNYLMILVAILVLSMMYLDTDKENYYGGWRGLYPYRYRRGYYRGYYPRFQRRYRRRPGYANYYNMLYY